MQEQAESKVAGPAWNLTDEYPAIDAPQLDADLAAAAQALDEIDTLNSTLETALPGAGELAMPAAQPLVDAARQVFRLAELAARLLRNVGTYANCLLSVDSGDEAAQRLQGSLINIEQRQGQLLEVHTQLLDRASEDFVAAYLDDADTAPTEFQVRHRRRRRHELLDLEQEQLVGALAQDGIHAWGRLYTQLSGTLRCTVEHGGTARGMGLAQAAGLMQQGDESLRRAAWQAGNAAWQEHSESCAAAINAIAGWRLELVRRRSSTTPVHFLDAPLHMNKIERATLDALIDAAAEARPLVHRVARAKARATGRDALGPWDLRAPAPRFAGPTPATPFDEAMARIARAYGEVAPEMGDFVRMMGERRWVEGTVTDRKRPGAYCTRFPKSNTPRVYMTYTGSDSDQITLAHELGHALHNWVMRDLPESQRWYGMSLAETASTFGETTVRDAMLAAADSRAERFQIMWEEVGAMLSFLVNIPTRFAFEHAFYERRAERPLRPAELNEMMSEAWTQWYGDTMSEPDPLYWCSKLHFFISGLSFYNFPYLFGYLFSLGVYQRKADWADEFYPRYVALLRDTGRMTAEDLARKHLDVDMTSTAFWRETISAMAPRVDAFESVVDDLLADQ